MEDVEQQECEVNSSQCLLDKMENWSQNQKAVIPQHHHVWIKGQDM